MYCVGKISLPAKIRESARPTWGVAASRLRELDHMCPKCRGPGHANTAAWLSWRKIMSGVAQGRDLGQGVLYQKCC